MVRYAHNLFEYMEQSRVNLTMRNMCREATTVEDNPFSIEEGQRKESFGNTTHALRNSRPICSQI